MKPSHPLTRIITCTALATILTFTSLATPFAQGIEIFTGGSGSGRFSNNNPASLISTMLGGGAGFGQSGFGIGGAGSPYGGRGGDPKWEMLNGGLTGLLSMLIEMLQKIMQKGGGKGGGAGSPGGADEAYIQSLRNQVSLLEQQLITINEDTLSNDTIYQAGILDGQSVVNNECGNLKDERYTTNTSYTAGYAVGLSICESNKIFYEVGITDGSKLINGSCLNNPKDENLKQYETYIAGFAEGQKSCTK